MGVVHSVTGIVDADITSADIPAALMAFSETGIAVKSVSYLDDLTVRITVSRKDYRKLKEICEARGDLLKPVGKRGLYWKGKILFKRPVLCLGMVFILIFLIYLPTKVLFLQVEGNERVPEKRILEAAEQCGIYFGASRRKVRSEQIKNALLQEIPELQWVGVNTYGCVGVVSVRERSISREKPNAPALGNIIALRDGIVSSCTAARGTLICQPGQAVLQGQILISGYTDCGLLIQATGADGEVYGTTNREISAVMPSRYAIKSLSEEENIRYSLLIGKKRINLWKDSGISDSSCGRIYEENYITLPGGFQLPFGWSADRWLFGSVIDGQIAESDAETQLCDFTQHYICQQMVAGSIESEEIQLELDDDVYRLNGEYVCNELIGKWQAEQIGEIHGKNS